MTFASPGEPRRLQFCLIVVLRRPGCEAKLRYPTHDPLPSQEHQPPDRALRPYREAPAGRVPSRVAGGRCYGAATGGPSTGATVPEPPLTIDRRSSLEIAQATLSQSIGHTGGAPRLANLILAAIFAGD